MKALTATAFLSLVWNALTGGAFDHVARLARHAMIEIGPCLEKFGAGF